MKRALRLFLAILLIVGMVAPCVTEASAEKTKVIYVLTVNVDGARVRAEPNSDSDNVETSMKKGTKVFYLGKSGAWIKVRSEFGVIGYTYKGFFEYYGAVPYERIYAADGSAALRKSPKTSAKRVTTLSDNQHVIVYAVRGSWAYVRTLSGKGGYIRKSDLYKAN